MKTNTSLHSLFILQRRTGGLAFALALVAFTSLAQTPVSISYTPLGSVNTNGLSGPQLTAVPKQCVIDFASAAASIRVVMESPDGSTNYVDRVFPLQVQAFPDSTFVYGKPGAWTIGLGQFESIETFRIRLLNPLGPSLGTAVAQGSYP